MSGGGLSAFRGDAPGDGRRVRRRGGDERKEKRQREIVASMARGLSNVDIAKQKQLLKI